MQELTFDVPAGTDDTMNIVYSTEETFPTVEEIKAQLEYREANKLEVEKFNVTRTMGENTKIHFVGYQNVVLSDDNGKITGKKFITYDDPESLTLKSQYVFEQGLGGLMFWELGYEYRESNPLVKAIYDVFYK